MNYFDNDGTALDQSKPEPMVSRVMSPDGPVGVTDSDLRLLSLRFALQAHAHPDGIPDDVIETTRDFYLFLIGEDPIVDGPFEEDAADGKPSAEIIPFRVARKDHE